MLNSYLRACKVVYQALTPNLLNYYYLLEVRGYREENKAFLDDFMTTVAQLQPEYYEQRERYFQFEDRHRVHLERVLSDNGIFYDPDYKERKIRADEAWSKYYSFEEMSAKGY